MLDGANSKKVGRWIGFAYLLALVFSTASDVIMSGMFDGGPDSAAMRLSPQLARLTASLSAAVIGSVAWLAASLLLVRLTRAARPIAGRVLLVPLAGGILVDLYAQSQLIALIMSRDASGAPDWFGPAAQHYQQATMAWQVCYGLWLLPFGWLVARAHIAPRTIGICLIAGGCGYPLLFATLLGPAFAGRSFQVLRLAFGVAEIVGELGICAWLLAFGAREPAAHRMQTS